MKARFRFHESDRETYGDGEYLLDQDAILRLPAKELLAIERETLTELGASVAHLLLQWYGDTIAAKLGLSWIACRMAGRVGKLADWQPVVLLIEWEAIKESRPEGGDADPPDGGSHS